MQALQDVRKIYRTKIKKNPEILIRKKQQQRKYLPDGE